MVLPARRALVHPQLVPEQEIVPDIVQTNDEQLLVEWARFRQLTLNLSPLTKEPQYSPAILCGLPFAEQQRHLAKRDRHTTSLRQIAVILVACDCTGVVCRFDVRHFFGP